MDYRIYKLLSSFISSIVLMISVLFLSCNTDDYDEPPIIDTETDNDYESGSKDDNETSNDDRTDNNDSIEGEDLLLNGGFEKWVPFSDNLIEEWFCHNNDNVTRDCKIVYDGRYSAKMQSKKSGSTATVDQSVPVEPGGKIRIRFHYYVEQWKAKGARTYCYFRKQSAGATAISADDLKAFYDKDTYYIIRGGGYGLTYLPHDLNVWHVFDETIKVPPTATYFVFGVNSYYGTTIYVDDCSVMNITEHSTSEIF